MCNLCSSTIELLARDHSRSLKGLEVCSYSSGFSIPPSVHSYFPLQKLVINSVPQGSDFLVDTGIFHAISAFHGSLRELSVGFEEFARVAYVTGNISNHTGNYGMQTRLTIFLAHVSYGRPLKLDHVKLLAVDVCYIYEYGTGPFFDFNALKSLSLESCSRLETVLPVLSRADHGPGSPRGMENLRSLTIRSEFPGESLQGHLQTFICSLTGLTSLFVMLDGVNTSTIQLETVLAVHGERLQKLIWDTRTGCRTSPRHDVSIIPPSYSHLDLISRLCPNLVELGSTFDWKTISTDQDSVCEIGSLWL